MVDAGRLAALLERLGAETAALRLLGQRSQQELLDDETALPAAKYRFVVAIEAVIDACEHVIASEGLRASDSYADAVVVLAESGWLEPQLGARLAEAASFRNLLMHGYARVDDRRVVDILKSRVSDLEAFRSAIARRALSSG